jgi:hypothetical protein
MGEKRDNSAPPLLQRTPAVGGGALRAALTR